MQTKLVKRLFFVFLLISIVLTSVFVVSITTSYLDHYEDILNYAGAQYLHKSDILRMALFETTNLFLLIILIPVLIITTIIGIKSHQQQKKPT